MTAFRKVLPLLILLCIAGLSAQAATWTTIDVPTSTFTELGGINTAGDVVGGYDDAAGTRHGFVLRTGQFTTIDPPGATATYASGINDLGQITGTFQSSDGHSHGFLFDGQTFTILDIPGVELTFAAGINNAGEIVGGYTDAKGQGHGVEWSNGSFVTIDVPGSQATGLSGINDDGHIVGVYADEKLRAHGFVLNPKGAVRKFAFRGTTIGINDSKMVVGQKGHYGFRFGIKTQSFFRMQFPGAINTGCNGVNESGQVVGNYEDAGGIGHGFLRTK